MTSPRIYSWLTDHYSPFLSPAIEIVGYRSEHRMRRLSKRIDPDVISILILLAFGLVAYANSFLGSFHYDDITHIVENDAIFDLSNIGRIYSYCEERFLTYFTLALNYRFSELDPLGYHIFNFFIHYLAACFLYFLFMETWKTPAMKEVGLEFSRSLAAFLAAGIFILHPIQTQSVTYIIQRAESMAGMFYLGALFFYVRARLSPSRHAATGYYGVVILCALAAAFSKETAVTLPVTIVIYEIFFFNTRIAGLLRNKLVFFSLLPAGIIVVYKLGPLVARNFYYDYEPGMHLTRKQYFLTQLSVLVTYLRLFFWPADQNLDWDYPVAVSFLNIRTLTSLFLLISLILLAVIAYRKFRLFSFGIIVFFVTLAPTSSIIPIKDVIYEHRMYLAVAFLAMGCVHVLLEGFARFKSLSRQPCLIGLVLTIAAIMPLLAGLTHARNEVWVSELSLWEDAANKSPNKARVRNNYGRALYMRGVRMTDAAKKEFEIANRLSPGWALPYHNLALVYIQEGDYQRAIESDHKAIELDPDYKDALYQLGESHRELNQWEEARIYLERLISLSPGSKFLQAYLDLLEVYLQLGLRDEAFNLAEVLSRMDDPLPRLDYYRGMAFFILEDFVRAKFYFTRQTKHKSKKFTSYLILGHLHYLEKDYSLAENAFRRVLNDQPWSAAAHYNLAIVLEKRGRLKEAMDHLEKAMAVDFLSLAPRIRLVKLYDHAGDSSKRIELLKSLLGLKPNSTELSFLKANKDRNLNATLYDYLAKFVSGAPSPYSEKVRAIVATLKEDYHAALERYQRCMQTITDPREKKIIEKEVHRLEGILDGREPLEKPA